MYRIVFPEANDIKPPLLQPYTIVIKETDACPPKTAYHRWQNIGTAVFSLAARVQGIRWSLFRGATTPPGYHYEGGNAYHRGFTGHLDVRL